ncbi:MAG: hypothetical protein QME42_11305, partial [bacterium]|nr:hypothetical protein [bacterium]
FNGLNYARSVGTRWNIRYMQSGGEYKMQTMNMSLKKLYESKLITYENALKYSPKPEELSKSIGGQYYYFRENQ